MSIPAELERREERLAAIAAAKTKIAARAAERFAREHAEYEAKRAARAARVAATGKKLGGTAPKASTPGPRVDDQINLTNDASRIMPVADGGFEQCYNVQAMVDPERMLVVIPQVVQAVNKKQQVLPMLAQLQALPAGRNGAKRLAVDGVLDHPIGDGLLPISHPWTGQCPGRVDAGLPGVEPETDGRITSAVRGIPWKSAFLAENRLFFAIKARPRASGGGAGR